MELSRMKTLVDKSNVLFYFTILFCCAYILFASYFFNVYISPDTAFYLREAENLFYGHGFNYNGLAHGENWFSIFPILHPFLICCIMKFFGFNAYLSSKILSCICLIVLSVVIKKNYKECFPLFSSIFLNFGFIWCALYSLSEIPFITFLVLSIFSLSHLMENEGRYLLNCCCLFLFSLLTFLTRYFGLYILFLLFFYLLRLVIKYIKTRNPEILKKIIVLTSVEILLFLFIWSYFYINSQMSGFASGGERFVFTEKYLDLAIDCFSALLAELYGLFGNLFHGLFFLIGHYTIIVFGLLMGIGALFLRRKMHFCASERAKVFVTAGMFYYIIFIIYRFSSTMDHFYYRFFVPGTILLVIGGIEAIKKTKKELLYTLNAIFLTLLITSYTILGLTYYKGTGFPVVEKNVKEVFCEKIRPNSVLLFSYGNINFLPVFMWLRTDVLLYILPDNQSISIQNIMQKFSNRSIYVDKKFFLENLGRFKDTQNFDIENIKKSEYDIAPLTAIETFIYR